MQVPQHMLLLLGGLLLGCVASTPQTAKPTALEAELYRPATPPEPLPREEPIAEPMHDGESSAEGLGAQVQTPEPVVAEPAPTPAADLQVADFLAKPARSSKATKPQQSQCCKRCGSNSKPCGNSCISLAKTCHTAGGCAC